MTGWLDNPLLTLLEKGLDASSLRQRVIANNVANVDTPGFKRSDVDFSAVLGEALGRTATPLPLKLTSEQHLPGIADSAQTGVVVDQSTTLRNDGNNVDIDKEMTNVAENGLYYNAAAQVVSSQLGLLRMVIQEKP